MEKVDPAKRLEAIQKATYGITGLTVLALASLWIGVGPRAGLSLKESLLGGVVTPLMVGTLGYLVANPPKGLGLPSASHPSHPLSDRIGEWIIGKFINF